MSGAHTTTVPVGLPALWRLKVLYAALGAGIGSLMPYLVLYLSWRGLSPAHAGLVLGLMSGVGVVAQLYDRYQNVYGQR